MKFANDFFPVGATYAPLPKATEVPVSEWPGDLETMAKLGFTTFRLFICWDRVEQERGNCDFSRIDRSFELAKQYGLKVIANVGGTFTNLQAIYPPRWLVYDLGCTLLKPEPDASEELHFNRFKLCYDDPVYQREARNFIRKAIARYKDHPNLIAWSGWNEPRLAECYCRHTVATYREWLKNKYGTPEAVANAWSSEFPIRFRSWDDIFPQPKASFEDGGYVAFLDWREFLAWNRTDKFHMVCGWIREVDPETPVISHMCGPYNIDIFGQEDILGTSIYTIHAQGKTGDYKPYEFTTRQNLHFMPEGSRAHRADPEGFWCVETEAGPVSWVHNLIPRSYSPRKMNARDVLFVAHGARAILRWLYRSRISDAQAGEFNMVGWDGRVTGRAAEFGKLAEFLNRHHELFLHHTDDPSGVMILDVRDCDSLSAAEGYGYRYANEMHNLYNALLHIGVRARFCNARQLAEGILNHAKVLFIPVRPHVDPSMADLLREFVKNGGTLLAESPFAIKDMRGIHYEVTPGGLTDVFGAQVYDLEKLDEPSCGGIPAFDFRAKIECLDGQVEGRFANGDPAIVTHRFGKGKTVLYGSDLFDAYQLETPLHGSANPRTISWTEGETLRSELRKRLFDAGVRPTHELLNIDDDSRKNIQVLFRRLPGGGRLLFVLNMDDKPNRFALRFRGMEQFSVLGDSENGGSATPACDMLDFRFREWGWCILKA